MYLHQVRTERATLEKWRNHYCTAERDSFKVAPLLSILHHGNMCSYALMFAFSNNKRSKESSDSRLRRGVSICPQG